MKSFFAELKRRNVYKVAVAYGVVAWLLIQAASIVLPTFEAPGWVLKTFLVAVVAGFPIALIIAWAFEMTPEGLKRTENISADEKIPQWSRRKFAALILTIAVIAAGLLAFQLFRAPKPIRAATENNKSIAVLRFAELSEDKANAYFADGIQDDIRLASLAQGKLREVEGPRGLTTASASSTNENGLACKRPAVSVQFMNSSRGNSV